jgi:hypothetical protein
VWGVVREGLGESEEGIKDIFPLSLPHCFYLCLLELGGESKGKLGGAWRSLKERTKRSLEERAKRSLKERTKRSLEERTKATIYLNLQDSRAKEVIPNPNSLISLG